ncbi:Mut7-C RNAse domain-containing protein [Halobacteria archaeon AArc-m2/3/4]|uniref:Mut7-C RNAse domain-containing protein n=1 Tax=Natronoglomus mannanivorans TaxID=2979990 RepID=A0ABT2QDU1_9EURY|nr:Mut7-C RNAse domain-containing protein [Halobacteria archaeon AArc-m2/3/4]
MPFLVDVMCGGLVSYLRMCGYDTAYAGDRDLEADDEVLVAARSEERTIVTRDVDLAARAESAILLESRETEAQLAELETAGVALELADEPSRCGRCNGRLERVTDTPASIPEYAPDPDEERIWQCGDCDQWFWTGSHWDRVRETLARVRGRDEDAAGKDRGTDADADEPDRQ